MQQELLDILILGLLILVFGAIHRRRAVPRIRYWTLGWGFILLHFAVLAFVANPYWQSVIGVSALILAGCAFLLASNRSIVNPLEGLLVGALVSAPSIAYLAITSAGSGNAPVLLALVAAGEFCLVYIAFRFWSADAVVLRSSVGIALITTTWMVLEIYKNHSDDGINAILAQIFLINCVLYWRDFRRYSAGVLTVVLGLFAWALVFPISLILGTYWPRILVAPELWNVPKYFVEFGMILTLLEEEIISASRQSEDYRLLFESNPHPMWILDLDTLGFLKVNDAALQEYGYSEEEFLRMSLRDIRPADEVPRMLDDVNLAGERVLFAGPWTHIRKNGTTLQVEVAAHTILFEGRTARFCLVLDVTEREQLHQQLLYQAHHDLLTGLPNRLLLKDRMQQTLMRAARYEQKVAFVCMDLDRFKQINDTYGHLIGDLCLKQVAERLRFRLRAEDTIARSGGEEFVAILGELATREDAQRVAEDLIQVFRRPFLAEGYQLDLPASIGIALYPDDGTDCNELWRSADIAMYRAKKSGGNNYIFVSDEISSAASEANDLELFMRRALKEGGFELYYQPQYSQTGELSGLEALIRLHHPRLGLVMPDRFIPIAEDSGLIIPIGSWVLEQVARQSVEWADAGLTPCRIAVNVSPLQFMHSDFLSKVQQVLRESGMPPSLLEIEVTETTVMRNVEDIARQMRELAALGVQFSVDDFGTGYSSLRHLHQLPIQMLKIDRSFIERITDPGGTYSIVQAILSLAHSLDMQVVAEGVENADQVTALRSLNCDMFQGYLFSRPVPASKIPAILQTTAPVASLL